MNRLKTYDATGIAPNGKLFSGDLNALQDAVAALTDLTQNLSVASMAIGESGLLLSRFGAGEAQVTGHLRTSGIMRGLGGLYAGAFTSTARDAITAPPTGLVIYNTTTNRWEANWGTAGAPAWGHMLRTITDSEIAVGAAISPTKILGGVPKMTTSAYSGGPPASPADTDIWTATGVEGSANRWMFQYDAAWVADAYKWKFVGGPSLVFYQDASLTTTSATYNTGTAGTGSVAATLYAPSRSGIYQARASCVAQGSTPSTFQFGLLMGGSNYNGSIFVWDLAARYAQGYAEQEAVCAAGGNTIAPLIAVSSGTLTATNRRLVVVPARII